MSPPESDGKPTTDGGWLTVDKRSNKQIALDEKKAAEEKLAEDAPKARAHEAMTVRANKVARDVMHKVFDGCRALRWSVPRSLAEAAEKAGCSITTVKNARRNGWK